MVLHLLGRTKQCIRVLLFSSFSIWFMLFVHSRKKPTLSWTILFSFFFFFSLQMIFSGVVFLSFSSWNCWSAFVYINCVSMEISSLCCISFGHVPLNDVKVDIKKPKGRGSGWRISQDATHKLWNYKTIKDIHLSALIVNGLSTLLPSKLNWKTGGQHSSRQILLSRLLNMKQANSFGSKSKSAAMITREKRSRRSYIYEKTRHFIDGDVCWNEIKWLRIKRNIIQKKK